MIKLLVSTALICLQFRPVLADGECPDINGRLISQGLHYVPGPNKCTLCICDNGQPKWCKAVLCSTPQDCKTFRLGNTCCEFICLDDTLVKHPDVFDAHHDFGLRLIAGAITVILFLSILSFMIHRLRRRKLRGRQNRQQCEDERSLASIGFIGGSMSYVGNNCYEVPITYPVWKPPGSYFPRGEAPPPYDEAIAQNRNDSNRQASSETVSTLHGNNTLGNHSTNAESVVRNSACSIFGHNSTSHNNDVRFSQTCRSNNDNLSHAASVPCNHAQLSYSGDKSVERSSTDILPSIRTQHIVSTGNGKLGSVKITSSISLTGARALLNAVTRGHSEITNRGITNNAQSKSSFYVNSNAASSKNYETGMNSTNLSCQSHSTPTSILASSSRHRTIPRNQATISSIIPNDIHPRTHETLKSQRATEHHKLSERVLQAAKEIISNGDMQRRCDFANLNGENAHKDRTYHGKAQRQNYNSNLELINHKESDLTKKPSSKSFSKLSDKISEDSSFTKTPTDIKKPSCGCSFDCQPPALTGDDQEDYYSECENCKSSGSSYYVEWSPCETMTLQRRGKSSKGGGATNAAKAPPRAGATLPTNSHATDRLLNGSSENRESWFNSIPGSSSSEDE